MSHSLPRPLMAYTSLQNKDKKDIDEIIDLLEKNDFKKVDKTPKELISNEYCINQVKTAGHSAKKVYNIDWKI
jgi:hypothetical protein